MLRLGYNKRKVAGRGKRTARYVTIQTGERVCRRSTGVIDEGCSEAVDDDIVGHAPSFVGSSERKHVGLHTRI